MQAYKKIVASVLTVVAIAPMGAIARAVEPEFDPAAAPSVTKALPANVAGVFLINTSQESWSSLNRYNPLPIDLKGPGSLPFLPPEINFAEDVQPWLGEWTGVALLPLKSSAPSDTEQSIPAAGILMVAPVTDAAAAEAFTAQLQETLQESRQEAPIEKEYQGIKILEWPAKVPPPLEDFPKNCPDSEPDCNSEESLPPAETEPSSEGEELPNWQQMPVPEVPELPKLPPAQPFPPAPEVTPVPELPPLPSPQNLPSPRPLRTLPPVELQPPQSLPQPRTQLPLSPKSILSKFALGFLPGLSPSRYRVQAANSESPELVEPSLEETEPFEEEMPPVEFEPVVESQPGLAIALLPGYLAASTSSAAIEEFIDSQKNSQAEKTSLADTPGFQRTLKHPEFSRSLMAGYLNFNAAIELDLTAELPEIPGGFPLPLPPLSLLAVVLEPLGMVYNTAEVLTWVQPEGIRSQAGAYFRLPQLEEAVKQTGETERMLAKLPGTVYFAYNSRNLKQQWKIISTLLSFGEPPAIESVREFVLNSTGLDIDRDIFDWMDGEYALFFFPTTQGLLPALSPQFSLGIGVMVQTSDRPTAENTIAKLQELVETSSAGSVTVANYQQGDRPVISWETKLPQQSLPQSIFAYRWTDDNTLILTTGTGPMAALDPAPNQSLLASYNYQVATASLPQPNVGSFYMNWGAVMSFFLTFAPPDDSETSRIVRQIIGIPRSLSYAVSTTPEKVQTDFFLVLGAVR